MLETTFLQREHRAVLAKLDVLERGLNLAQTAPAEARPHLVEAAAFLLANLEVHLDREEKGLFPRLEAQTGPQGPLHVMMLEHEQLRRQMAVIGAANADLAAGALPPGLLGASRDLLSVLRSHILKEDQILFPMAERVIPHDVLEELEETCKTI